jgi:hypothetical protein
MPPTPTDSEVVNGLTFKKDKAIEAYKRFLLDGTNYLPAVREESRRRLADLDEAVRRRVRLKMKRNW